MTDVVGWKGAKVRKIEKDTWILFCVEPNVFTTLLEYSVVIFKLHFLEKLCSFKWLNRLLCCDDVIISSISQTRMLWKGSHSLALH